MPRRGLFLSLGFCESTAVTLLRPAGWRAGEIHDSQALLGIEGPKFFA